ncbi:MAG: carbonic anhydrase [Candidatus Hermodarchaeota archaeon]
MNEIENLLIEGNYKFQRKIAENPDLISFENSTSKYPILFLTCMDPRIDIHQIFNLNPGDVFILRNAGNIYTLDMMRSILITIHKYKIKYIIVLGHYDCRMTKINMNEFRQNLPNDFLRRLSINYSSLLSKLFDFFKPFDNEIRNVINQINNLQEIKALYPYIEIIGMIYDVRNGWIFTQEEFRDLLITENHTKIYNGLLFEKNQQLSKYFKSDNSVQNQVSSESVDETEVNEMCLQKNLDPQEIEESRKRVIGNGELQKSIENENVIFQLKMPKIQVPKIYIPKIKIYKPKIKNLKRK